MGDQLARVALSVLVFARTDSAALTGLTYALTFVPAFIGGALFGAFIGAFLSAGLLLNKALNDMVHSSRAAAGLGRLADTPGARNVPPTSMLGQLRRAARWVPFHRIFHSIEMTMLTLVVAVLGALLGHGLLAARLQVLVMAVVIVPVVLGHLLAILASPRLRSAEGSP